MMLHNAEYEVVEENQHVRIRFRTRFIDFKNTFPTLRIRIFLISVKPEEYLKLLRRSWGRMSFAIFHWNQPA